MPIADPFEHRATRNARQPALRLCIEACPLIYDPLHYLDFKSPEVGTEEVSRGFPHGDLWGTIVENGTKLLAGQTRCLISTKRLSRIAEDQREEAIPGHSVQLRLCWHEFAELLVGIRHPSRSPIERSLFCHVTAVRTAPCRSSDRKTWYDFGAAVHEPNRSQHFTNGFGRNIPLLV